jgi:hypothetical protein
MVWPPDRATTSVGSKVLAARDERIVSALSKGGGRLSKVALRVAKFRPSRLPKGTS